MHGVQQSPSCLQLDQVSFEKLNQTFNKNYKKESIIDSGEDSIIDRLDLIPEEFDVENQNDDVSVPVE